MRNEKTTKFVLRRKSLGDVEYSEKTLHLSDATIEAVLEVNRGRKTFRFREGRDSGCDLHRHADGRIIREWVDKHHADANEMDVIRWLALAVRREWANLPHRTKTQHRELFARVVRLCGELKAALIETDDRYFRAGGYGLQDASVRDLLTDAEKACFAEAFAAGEYELQDYRITGAFPSMEELLDRVASAADRLERAGPMHSQPKKRGAERGYFVRRIGELFMQRYKAQPAEVIAALTTIALGEATDRELVAKLLK